MSDWRSNEIKIFWKIFCKLRFSERPLDIVRERLSQFGVVLEVWLPGVISTWKFAILKEEIPYWPGNDRKMTSHSERFRGFKFEFDVIWEVWFSEVII